MSVVCEFDINNQIENFEFEKMAKQANGSAVLKVGKAVLLATVVSEFDNPVSEDFTPLTVQYIEKTYAAAKIAGGYIKREGKPSDFETLTSRVIDRSLRPLFPKGYIYPTTITVMVLSADENVDLQVLALNVASAALYISNLPIKKAVCGVRIGKVANSFVINPTKEQMGESELDLYVAGTKEELLMIEMKSISSEQMIEVEVDSFTKIHRTNEMSEDELISAIKIAGDAINEATNTYEKGFENICKDTFEVELLASTIDEQLIDFIKQNYTNDIKQAIKKLAKSERSVALKDIANTIQSDSFCEDKEIEYNTIFEAVNLIKREFVRDMIVNEQIRADGRGLKDVRPIDIETNILPSAHSSCLFTRGETQALVIATLGGEKDGQMYELLSDKTTKTERFMVHYNFPGFSVGEAKPVFGVSRRELGHGNLAKKALESSIDKDFSDTVRLVSEILESNGSSSMATVCGGSLALKAAGVPISSLIAGVAMGMIVENNKYAILTDIMGLEDHDGDMDFKVTGSNEGITALQMDIKLGGISLEVLKEALLQAKEAREHILQLMEEASNQIVPSEALPLVEQFLIDPKSVMAVIGKAGSVIKEIIQKFEVAIDLDRDSGNVKLTGEDKQKVQNAKEHILNISSNANKRTHKTIDFTKIYKIDEVYNGKIVRIADFGAFVSLPNGGEGLLHISKLSNKRVNKVEDIVSANQEIDVKVIGVKKDRIELSLNF
jgi:polyribonucleotide nucleotidyltransferase